MPGELNKILGRMLSLESGSGKASIEKKIILAIFLLEAIKFFTLIIVNVHIRAMMSLIYLLNLTQILCKPVLTVFVLVFL